MPWVQFVMDLEDLDCRRLEDVLLRNGATSICLQDAADNPVFEPAPGTTPLWPHTRLSALLPIGVDREDLLRELRDALETGELPNPQFELIEDRPWEREWLRDWSPMRFGARLWVCRRDHPPMEPPAVTVHIDPGLAFGTGTHPTTAMCLQWLDGADLGGHRIMDYGCGSGILAIAAAKLGADSVIAVDNDPQALKATRDNAGFNGVGDIVRVVPAEEAPRCNFDCVVANILADPLFELAPRFAEWVTDGGSIVLSGILARQSDRLTARYGRWFDMQLSLACEGWVRLSGMRRRLI